MNAVANNVAESEFQTMDESLPRLTSGLELYMGVGGARRFCALLKETGSLVAGGCVLGAYDRSNVLGGQAPSRWSSAGDVDIYVPVKQERAFLSAFVRDPGAIFTIDRNTIENSYKSTLYCRSFLQKNGIRKVYNFRFRLPQGEVEFDIMIVRNRRTPLQVVNNFDLTFCQTWFDGEHIYASHPQDIKEKRGTLQGEYVALFLQGNDFLRKRIKKYGDRGYTVVLDKRYVNEELTDILRIEGLYRSRKYCERPDNDVMMRHWSSRVLLYWCLGIRNRVTGAYDSMTPSLRMDNLLLVPLLPERQSRAFLSKWNTWGGRSWRGSESQHRTEEGYDSEDFEENSSLQDIVFNKYVRRPSDLAPLPTEDTTAFKTLLVQREAFKLFELAMWSNQYRYNGRHESLGYLLEHRFGYERAKMYADDLRSRCVRKGTSFITQEDDADVYDIHEHPLEGGISADDLEGYLEYNHMMGGDKTTVPCYYKPSRTGLMANDPSLNCSHMLTLSEVKAIVSKEFYEKYTAPAPTKMGLDQFMGSYDQVLGDEQGPDANFPDPQKLYWHHSVCPYCLQFDSRDTGCTYMTHDNSKSLPDNKAPFCNERLQIRELVDRYRAVSDRGQAAHLEFCAECGRPTVDHEHVTTKPPYTKIPIPIRRDAQGRATADYVTCTGGGRAELFARVLAIRRVYREGASLDPIAERRFAALAADDAPNDPELMAQGQAIFAQEVAARHWTNAPIPATKAYNDPAYRDAPNAGSNNDSQAGGIRKTVKRTKKKLQRHRSRKMRA